MLPKVSIITTFYNSVKLGDFVNKSMESLLSQTYKNIEFICVHDGSPDETLFQLKEFQKKDSRIFIVDKKNEKTAQYAKAAGQDVATGDYIMLFDHDDKLDHNAIEKAVSTFLENPELEMVGFIVKVCFSDEKVRNLYNLHENLESIKDYKFLKLTGFEALKKTVGRYDFHFRGLYKKDAFKKISFRFSQALVNADEIVERQIWENIKFIGSCNAVYTHYIFLNSSAKSFNLKKTDFLETDIFLRKYFVEKNIYVERSKIFELTAYKNLVTGIKAYYYYRNELDKESRKFYEDRIKKSFSQLDKKILLENYSGIAKLYNALLVSNFKNLFYFYRFKK